MAYPLALRDDNGDGVGNEALGACDSDDEDVSAMGPLVAAELGISVKGSSRAPSRASRLSTSARAATTTGATSTMRRSSATSTR